MPECLLELKNIYKSFGGVKALENISLKINSGEVLCLAGENGCGKSTLIKIISGFYKPDSGSIIMVEEENREKKGNAQTGRNGIGKNWCKNTTGQFG